MKGRIAVLIAAAAVLAATASCARYPQKADAGQPAAPGTARAALPAAMPAADPAPRMMGASGGQSAPQIPFNSGGPSITELLDKTQGLLLQANAESDRLRLALAESDKKLAEKDAQIKDLTAQLSVASGDVGKLQEALEKWKADVLGFRDEMRKADEAEIQVLQEVLMLLKGFAKEKPTQ